MSKEVKVINEEANFVFLVGSENPTHLKQGGQQWLSLITEKYFQGRGIVIIVSPELKAETSKEIRKLLISHLPSPAKHSC